MQVVVSFKDRFTLKCFNFRNEAYVLLDSRVCVELAFMTNRILVSFMVMYYYAANSI